MKSDRRPTTIKLRPDVRRAVRIAAALEDMKIEEYIERVLIADLVPRGLLEGGQNGARAARKPG